MSERGKRKKASAVYAETDHPFAGSFLPFEKTYPMIKKLEAKIKELSYSDLIDEEFPYRPNLMGQFVDCSNPLCYDGGISMAEVIRKMVKQNAKEYHEGEPLAKFYEKRGNWKPTRYFLDCWKNACNEAKLTGKLRHDFRRSFVRFTLVTGVQIPWGRLTAIFSGVNSIFASNYNYGEREDRYRWELQNFAKHFSLSLSRIFYFLK